MSIDVSKSIICTATEYGAYGPYQVGIEYVADDDHVHHVVRRPIVRREFVGYGLTPAGHGEAVEAVSHDGPMSEWRTAQGGEAKVTQPRRNPPYLNLPDEEHGYMWGDPIDVPATEPTRWYWMGREVSEREARDAMAAYASAHPEVEPAPGWENRAVERARRERILR